MEKIWFWGGEKFSRVGEQSQQWGKVSIMEAPPLFVLLGWVVSRGGTDILLHRWWRGGAAWTPEVRQPQGARKCAWLLPTVPRCVHVCAHTYFFALFTNALLYISAEPPTCLKVLPEVRARGKEREQASDRGRERCNRIITQDSSLKGTAAGGPIWALHQQTHASIATST